MAHTLFSAIISIRFAEGKLFSMKEDKIKIYLDNCCYNRPFESEIFILNLKQERFDYTEWRQNLYEDMSLDELFSNAAEFENRHPELISNNTEIL